ncbi:hypothetical protein NTG1052_950008 [Candidatus Nitrotoga sp. 1052]|nr:hypothetical protein NTG1052_950008 [Candidatus Nitrotoga sp. 1052]
MNITHADSGNNPVEMNPKDNIESLTVHCYQADATSFYKTMETRIIFMFPFLN